MNGCTNLNGDNISELGINPPKCNVLDKWVFDNFILADE